MNWTTRYRHSVAGRVSTTVPHLGTKFSAGYKWLSGPTVSQLGSYGESVYQLDPYLSMQIRQPLPKCSPAIWRSKRMSETCWPKATSQ